MPTVDSIVRQKNLIADVSEKLFRNDIDAAKNSVLTKGPTDTADNMITSGFGLRSGISEMLGSYTEDRENFTSEFDRTISSLRESSDRLKESVQQREDEQLATRRRAQETEYNRRESAERFADAARQDAEENRQVREERADRMSAANLERMRDDLQAQRDGMERFANAVRERIQDTDEARVARAEQFATDNNRRVQSTREQTERFAAQYLVAENQTRQTQADAAQNLNAVRDANANAALSNVRNLVNRFNDAVDYFNQNRGVSNRMSALAVNFNEARNSEGLNTVGITIGDDGRLRVNETRLNDALNENSANVNELLGRNGLAGRLDRSVELANAQRDDLFTDVTDYVNAERAEPTESLYALQLNQTAAHAGEVNWRFLNMFT